MITESQCYEMYAEWCRSLDIQPASFHIWFNTTKQVASLYSAYV